MDNVNTRILLPSRLDLPAAAPLADAILAQAGKPLTLDAKDCETITTPGLQVLLSAAASWKSDGTSLEIEGLSTECQAQLALFGLTPDDICSKGNAQ